MKFCRILSLALLFLTAAASAQKDANALLQAGKANEALAALQQRVQGNPNDALAYSLIARVYFQLERWDDSVQAAERAVSLKPDSADFHHWLGRAYGRKAEISNPIAAYTLARKVKAEFERAVSLSSTDLSALADLAEYYIEAPGILGGDKVKALRLADSIALHDKALGHYIRGRVEEKRGKKARAETEFKSAIAESSLPALDWVDLASFYQRSGRLDDMQAAVEKALVSPGHDSIALFYAAKLLLTGGRNFPGAIQMLRSYLAGSGLAEEGPSFQAHYCLGVLLEKSGDAPAAAAEYRAALALASQYKRALDALARISR